MMKLYHIPFPRSIGLFSHQPILGMQFNPTTVSYWQEKKDGRKVLLKRVKKPLMTSLNGLSGYSCLKIPTECSPPVLNCYICYSRRGVKYYSIAPNLITAMQTFKFWTTKGRVYPPCQATKESSVPPLVPQLTWPHFSY